VLSLNSVMVGTKQSEALIDFYSQVIGRPPDMTDTENGFAGWQVGNVYFGVLDHSEMAGSAKDPGRLMFNFETSEVKAEFDRIKTIGGKVIREPSQMGEGWLATLADPDGNYFQLMTPMM
jgi:predicted enzyme related to lactoylglutathione lyase